MTCALSDDPNIAFFCSIIAFSHPIGGIKAKGTAGDDHGTAAHDAGSIAVSLGCGTEGAALHFHSGACACVDVSALLVQGAAEGEGAALDRDLGAITLGVEVVSAGGGGRIHCHAAAVKGNLCAAGSTDTAAGRIKSHIFKGRRTISDDHSIVRRAACLHGDILQRHGAEALYACAVALNGDVFDHESGFRGNDIIRTANSAYHGSSGFCLRHAQFCIGTGSAFVVACCCIIPVVSVGMYRGLILVLVFDPLGIDQFMAN